MSYCINCGRNENRFHSTKKKDDNGRLYCSQYCWDIMHGINHKGSRYAWVKRYNEKEKKKILKKLNEVRE